MKFIRPKTPPRKTSGYLILESDDSNIGDYTHWYPLIEKMIYKNTQWTGRRAISCGFNVNTGTLNTYGKMSDGNIRELHKLGYEIMNHCRHHISLGRFEIAKNANKGDTKLFLNTTSNTGFQHLKSSGYIYTYKLFNEHNEEIVEIIDYDTTEKTVTLKEPLSQSFGLGTEFQISDESMEELVLGCTADLQSLGIDVKNFSFPYHGGSWYNLNPDAISYASTKFNSSRGRYGEVNEVHNINWSNLEAFGIRTHTSFSQIDELLDRTVKNNYLTIAFGHGESDDRILDNLEYMINGALQRGIMMLRRQDAYELLK